MPNGEQLSSPWLQYAKPGPYKTQLSPQEEQQFQQWVKTSGVDKTSNTWSGRPDPTFNAPDNDYDMRGFWRAMVSGDPNAKRAANLHFPDTWKTPFERTFSKESMYALPTAGHWEGDKFVPPNAQHQSFLDIAKSFPADMPEETYKGLQRKYFQEVVAPKIKPGESHEATWEQFEKVTNRPKTLTTWGSLTNLGDLTKTAAAREMLKPLAMTATQPGGGGIRQVYDWLGQKAEMQTRVAERNGDNARAALTAGSVMGQVVDFSILSEALLGPLSGAVVGDAIVASRAAKLAERTVRGGLTFGTYDALTADNGGRLTAGLRGFGVGAGWEFGLGATGLLLKRGAAASREVAEKLEQKAAAGERVPPEADRTIAQAAMHQAEVARLEGRSNFWQWNSGVPGARLVVKDVAGATSPIEIKPGREYEAYRRAMAVVKQGGGFEHFEVHPEDQKILNEFLRIQKGIESVKDKATVVHTSPGQAEIVARTAEGNGIQAEVVAPNKVRLETVEIAAPGSAKRPVEQPPQEGSVERPSGEEIEATLGGKDISPQNKMHVQRQVERIWDERIPEGDKARSIEIVRKIAPELLPENYAARTLPRSESGGLDMERIKADVEAKGMQTLGYTPNVSHIFPHPNNPNRVLVYVQNNEWQAARAASQIMQDRMGAAYEFHPLGPGGHVGEVPVSPPAPQEWWEIAQREERTRNLRRARFTTTSGRLSWDDIEELADFYNVPKGEVDFESLVGKREAEVVKSLEAVKSRMGEMERGEAIKRSAPTPKPVFLAERVPPSEANPISRVQGGWRVGDTTYPDIKRAMEASAGGKFRESAVEMRARPGIPKFRTDVETMTSIAPGATAATFPDARTALQSLGVQAPESLGEGTPGIFLRDNFDRNTVWHENLHANTMASGLFPLLPDAVADADRRTALGIINGLTRELPAYRESGMSDMVNEAYVHAGEAFRFNDTEYLRYLARLDTDMNSLANFVNRTSQNLLQMADIAGREGKPLRDFQRTVSDLIRRTDPNVSHAANNAAYETGSGLSTWYDPNRGWILQQGPTSQVTFPDIHSLWDHMVENDKNEFAPAYSPMMDRMGIRGGAAPPGKGPKGAPPPNPELPTGRALGWNVISALWRPMLPWAASLDDAVNRILRPKGIRLDIYDKVRAVDEAHRVANDWFLNWYKRGGDALKTFSQEKMYDVMQYLTYAPTERTTKVMNALKLTQEEALRAEHFGREMNELGEDAGIDVKVFLQNYYPKLRGAGWEPSFVWGPDLGGKNAGFWDKAVRYEGTLDPQDLHAARFWQFLLRRGMEKKFTGGALSDLRKLIRTKVGDEYALPGTIRYALTNYHNYMRGIPDNSLQVVQQTLGSFFDILNRRIATVNEHLPEGFRVPQITSPPRQVINRMMLLSYTMGLGLRPAIAIRDAMQAFTGGLTILGPERFGRALAKTLSSDAFKFADKSGALMRKFNVEEAYGDIFQEMPPGGKGRLDKLVRWSNKLLAPSRWGHNFGRAIVFTGEYNDALGLIAKFREGTASADDVLYGTTLHFADGPRQSQLLKEAMDKSVPIPDVAKKFGLEAVDVTQWPYRRGTQPLALRWGAGRILGQYGVWPLNYIDFMQKLTRKTFNKPRFYARAAVTWAAVNWTATMAYENAGIDASRWFWQSPMGFAGSPHWEFVTNLAKAPENTPEGRQARKAVLEYPLDFVPGMLAISNALKSIEEGGATEWPPSHDTVLRTLGFKPLPQHQQDLDWNEWVRYNLGYPTGRRRR
jgi:hypothetical protein